MLFRRLFTLLLPRVLCCVIQVVLRTNTFGMLFLCFLEIYRLYHIGLACDDHAGDILIDEFNSYSVKT